MDLQFSRSALLLGKEGLAILAKSHVMLFGVGGVGSYAAEGLARLGVGKITLVDNDDVAISNLNRQLPALHSTIGQSKVQVVKNRVLDINPGCCVHDIEAFYLPETPVEIPDSVNLVLDAIDTVSAKLHLIETCWHRDIPVLSAMGMGNRTDPTCVRFGDLFETSGDPLCRVMRHELRKRQVTRLAVVYSTQPPVPLLGTPEMKSCGHPTPGSLPFVPSVAGLYMAYYAAKTLLHLP